MFYAATGLQRSSGRDSISDERTQLKRTSLVFLLTELASLTVPRFPVRRLFVAFLHFRARALPQGYRRGSVGVPQESGNLPFSPVAMRRTRRQTRFFAQKPRKPSKRFSCGMEGSSLRKHHGTTRMIPALHPGRATSSNSVSQ